MHRLRENTRGRRARLGRDVPAMSTALPRTKVRGGVGESVERPDGVAKVKGEFQYGSDLRREGMRFGARLRSPHPHERTLSIDVDADKKMRGVEAVIPSAERTSCELFG